MCFQWSTELFESGDDEKTSDEKISIKLLYRFNGSSQSNWIQNLLKKLLLNSNQTLKKYLLCSYSKILIDLKWFHPLWIDIDYKIVSLPNLSNLTLSFYFNSCLYLWEWQNYSFFVCSWINVHQFSMTSLLTIWIISWLWLRNLIFFFHYI